MAKRHPFKKTKPGESIPVTARQLESFMLEHNGRFSSRGYDKFERMELMESPVRDAIHELKTYSLETLTRRFDVRLLGRGKRVFARLDAEDDNRCHFPLYIPRVLISGKHYKNIQNCYAYAIMMLSVAYAKRKNKNGKIQNRRPSPRRG